MISLSGVILHGNILAGEFGKLNYSYQTFRRRVGCSFSLALLYPLEDFPFHGDLLYDGTFSAEHRWKITTEKFGTFKGAPARV